MPKVVDWTSIKWGSFTNQFKAFKKQHPNSTVNDLEEFAEMILENPEHYKPRTLKRAHFYLNIIAPKIKKGGKLTARELKEFLNESYNKNAKENVDGFQLDKDLSSDTAKVYYNPETGRAVVAHRGTSGVKDWANNLAYAVGAYKYTDRYKKGKTAQDAAEKKYGKENISTLGHSQGSVNARLLGKDTKEIINLNPAYRFEIPAKNEYTVRSSGDVVSAPFTPVKTTMEYLYPKWSKIHNITIPSENKGIIGEHSPDILDRLGDKEIGRGRRVGGKRAKDIDWLNFD